MTSEHWAKLRPFVESALLLEHDQRTAFLRETIPDPDLLAEVERLVSFDEKAAALFSIESWQAAPRSTSWAPGFEIGNYRVIQELGRGGMGAVYLAERADGAYQHTVAIKVLQENIFTPALTERFKQERQILARLNHPSIARLLDGGVMPDGRPYLVLEYVDGKPIDQYCDEHALDVEARLRLFLRVADAVQSAHQQLVLHLDLKPANILVDPDGDTKLLDFGIARMLSETDGATGRNETTLRLLTPRYASPEQAKGAPLGVASDVFSLGTLLYRLLTGKLPYPIEGVPPLEAVRMLRETAPVVPSVAGPDATRAQLRGDLDTILLQALRKEPDRRYPTVAAFAEDIERHLASQPVLAHVDSFGYRAGKYWQRNRLALSAAAVVLMVVAGSVAAVAHSALVARRERATAERRLKDMRALAHSYVFDLDPKLEELPGSVAIRNFVLQNAEKYLETMSKEAADDDDLAQETAQGYSQIAAVQATLAMPSLSDHVASENSIRKALAIQKRLVEKHPTDVKERSVLIRQMQHLATMLALQGDIVGANEIVREAWEMGQPMRLVHPTPPRFTDLAAIAWDVAWTNCGNADLWNLADPVAALPWLDKAQELTEQHQSEHSDAQSKLQISSLLERIDISRAATLIQLGRGAEAGHLYEDAVRLTMLTKHNLNEDEMRRQIRIYDASYLLSIHDLHSVQMLEPMLTPATLHETGSDRAPTSDEADELVLMARIDLQSGRLALGKKRMTQGLDTLEKLYEADKRDAGVSSELAWDTFRMGQETSLDTVTRRHLYLRAMEVANAYAAGHPQVLSAALLAGECELGLAQLAASAHDAREQHERASAAAVQFQKVLAAHPVQPMASALLESSRALAAS